MLRKGIALSLKTKITVLTERFLDVILDVFIPYSLLAKTPLKNISFSKSIRFHYVFNQKIQRLQIVDILHNQLGIIKPLPLKVWWSRGLDNFGDELLPYLLAHIAGVECKFSYKKEFISIGSIIRFAKNSTTIWGSGIIRNDETMRSNPKCLAVRGPITRRKLLEQNINCPEVYGDPAMLFPVFYKPKPQNTNIKKLVVPHFKHTTLMKKYEGYSYISLDVQSCNDIEAIIDSIASAQNCVITSSLHAFIFCVAYKVPVAVFKLEKKNIGGDNIKFDDFCTGVGIEPITIHTLNNENIKSFNEISSKAKTYSTTWAPQPLLEALAEQYPTQRLLQHIEGLKV